MAKSPKPENRTKGSFMGQTGKRGTRRGAGCRKQAVSSGQAARYCLVSPDTIVNWIASGKIPAQRTVGGQFRIRLNDLRSFMVDHGMRTDQLDDETNYQPVCWEFWGPRSERNGETSQGLSCRLCPVYRSEATVCWKIRPLLPGGTVRATTCSNCLFFSSFKESDDDARSTTGKG